MKTTIVGPIVFFFAILTPFILLSPFSSWVFSGNQPENSEQTLQGRTPSSLAPLSVSNPHPRRRALVIGIDGCTGNQLHQRVWSDHAAPNIEALMTKGKYTSCENDRDPKCARAHGGIRVNLFAKWVTAAGWASVTTGVGVNHHQVIGNGHLFEKQLAKTTHTYPTFFSILKNSHLNLKTAAGGVAAFLTIQTDTKVDPGVIDYECGAGNGVPLVAPEATSSCNLTHRFTTPMPGADRDDKLIDWMSEVIEMKNGKDADVLMGVIDKVDSAGHDNGFSSNPGYLQAITTADALVGKLITLIDERSKNLNEDWLVVLTSDHGGHNYLTGSGGGHDTRLHEDEVVPFSVTVFSKNPYPLKDLKYPVRQMDAAPTILHWFGVTRPYHKGIESDDTGKLQAIF